MNSFPSIPDLPIVTVICICYNHQAFVTEALSSVINQTYSNIELIIIDDASSDNSVSVIQSFVKEHPLVQLLINDSNLGNCRSFNRAMSQANGKYIIDLAADDVLLDTRIEKQVNVFERLNAAYGVIFTNAMYINEQSIAISTHYPVDSTGKTTKQVPSGDVYKHVLQNYFICTPTMMMRKKILDELGGYDEQLSYEDFDFWIRSSRIYQYYYLDEVLTRKRRVKGSLSTKFYQLHQNTLLASTLIICQKAFKLNRNRSENKALAKTIRYHLRQSYYTQNFHLVSGYAALLKAVDKTDFITQVILLLSRNKINLWKFYKIYLRILQS